MCSVFSKRFEDRGPKKRKSNQSGKETRTATQGQRHHFTTGAERTQAINIRKQNTTGYKWKNAQICICWLDSSRTCFSQVRDSEAWFSCALKRLLHQNFPSNASPQEQSQHPIILCSNDIGGNISKHTIMDNQVGIFTTMLKRWQSNHRHLTTPSSQSIRVGVCSKLPLVQLVQLVQLALKPEIEFCA